MHVCVCVRACVQRSVSYTQSPPSSFVGKASLLFEKQPPQYPPQSISSQHGLGLGQSEPSVSRTTSMLHQQLRYCSLVNC